jgi:hypothetical protein
VNLTFARITRFSSAAIQVDHPTHRLTLNQLSTSMNATPAFRSVERLTAESCGFSAQSSPRETIPFPS